MAQRTYFLDGSNCNLLSDSKLAAERELSCLPNLAALIKNGELQPILSATSCIPFLAVITQIFCKHSRAAEICSMLEQPFFHKYMRNLEMADSNLVRTGTIVVV